MCQWKINWVINGLLIVLFVFLSCDGYIPGFMDLRSIGMTIEPGSSGAVLPEGNSPVILKFNTQMKEQETGGILQINSDAVPVEGDRFWKGNDLYFVPVPSWTAGVRYVLNISGTVYSLDGRELRLERYVSFYAINKSEPPLLESFKPADGESVLPYGPIPPSGTVIPCGTVIELYFSCPMERFSTESAFNLEGTGEMDFEWSSDDKVLKIQPSKVLLPWTAYHWTLKTSAKSRDGVPLVKEFSGSFSTDLDKLLPQVVRVFPVIASGDRWLFSGGDIEKDLGPGQGIAVEFGKPMGENMQRSLRFEPSLSGRTEALSDKSIVFIPSRDPEPKTAYTLIVSADTRDLTGLKLGEEYRVTFVPDIPFLETLSFSTGSIKAGFNGPVLKVPLNPNPQGILGFTIHFSLPFNTEAKQNADSKIILSPYFPGTLDPIALRSLKWISDDRIWMEWEGLKPGTANETHYYQLKIYGGKGGLATGGGMYFEKDQILFLEVIQ